MKRSRVFLVVLFCLIAPVQNTAFSEETGLVTAEGVAAVQEGAADIARDAAVEDAQKKAVEQAIGMFIDSRTQVEQYRVISDNILSRAKGYVKSYTILDERTDSGLLRVRISAEVALGRLSDELSAIGISTRASGGARTMSIVITGLTKKQLAKFKDVLVKRVRGVRNMSVRSFSGNVAKIQVDSKQSAQALSDELTLKDFGGFSVEVVGSTANSLELRVAPKQ